MSTLYRKYRPQKFSDIIGQRHIVQTLSNAIKNDRIGQAYLFTGPRGTGKTSIARILAKTINCANLTKEDICDPCEKCSNCQMISENKSLDIIEIDAASNTGVDNIRELRETVALPPTSLKYKVYIIDEVHMLSGGAFNALLKTLEEPPAHVVFILATTEIHKVPDTIISRCQRFDFARLPIQNIIEKLSLIAKSEKIKIDQESLETIAISAEGGMRDAESLLGQVIALEDKNITLKEVEEILGTADKKIVRETARDIVENNSTLAIQKINTLLEDGFDLEVFNKSLINHFRQLMLLKINPELKSNFSFEMTKDQMEEMLSLSEKAELPKIILTINLLLEAQNKINSFILPQLPLEIAIIKATHVFPAMQETMSSDQGTIKKKEEIKISQQETLEKNQSEKVIEPASEIEEIKKDKFSTSEANFSLDDVRSNWKKLLVDIRPFNHSLGVLLSSSQATAVLGNEITIATPYDFYKERLADPTNRLTVENVLGSILESKVVIHPVLDKSIAPKQIDDSEVVPETPSEQTSLLDSAMEIFGGKVVK